ncbi:nucleotidyltransferase substrate binding protein [Neobacillus sp. YIM B02564]|jgi:nucleotidyltransferase substrate binding protein (TIGR01987 family)|uniref:Nucleotidyltransferase substrate binding protein n=1 Tax=Neobacillus paridis TaxID=2803862 RepID=A0ABS1TUA0_9BACI|nr:nucleotidyltransferase substrate binding protein [Neobacillus paridis]MBL4953475.1 nucleotidyltransferase substrate binding protein [Neobacillus paridis]
MDPLKEIRWKQRFENFEKSFKLLEKYSQQEIQTELERAGIIQFFEMTFELAWKVLKDYLEAQGYEVKSPRDTIKLAFQIGLLEDGHVWIDALSSRNLTSHTYDEAVAEKLIGDIRKLYYPALKAIYQKLLEG